LPPHAAETLGGGPAQPAHPKDAADTLAWPQPAAPATAERGAPGRTVLGRESTVPEAVGPYRLLHSLGQGAMAAVHLGEHRETGRRVAIKLMLPHLTSDPMHVKRFLQEAEASIGLSHENIVELLTCGEAHGR